jgi:hypothetical protein
MQSLRSVPVVDGSLRRSVGRQSGRVPALERSISDLFQDDLRSGGRRRSTLSLHLRRQLRRFWHLGADQQGSGRSTGLT